MDIRKVQEVIDQLNEMDVDGETMQYILEQVGMQAQMHRQLVMSSPTEETEELVKEKYFLVEESVPSIIINTYIVKAKDEVEAMSKMMDGDYEGDMDMKIEDMEGEAVVINVSESEAPKVRL